MNLRANDGQTALTLALAGGFAHVVCAFFDAFVGTGIELTFMRAQDAEMRQILEIMLLDGIFYPSDMAALLIELYQEEE